MRHSSRTIENTLNNMIYRSEILKNSPIKRIVIWGLLKKYHTHRHIHQSYYKNAKKLGIAVLWVEDEKKNQSLIKPGDLIITADPVGKMVPEKFSLSEYHIPIRNDIFYCLHRVKDIFTSQLPQENILFLDWHKTEIRETPGMESWTPVTHFNRETRSLYQPWGTDLLKNEFKSPVCNRNSLVFWIGSVWNDKNNHGNIDQIHELKTALKKHALRFIQLRFIPDFLNIFFIRISRIAPAISGNQQVKVGYLPCRVFKNISYGQLGITNVPEFKEVLGDAFVPGETISELISNSLKLDNKAYLDLVKRQQEKIKVFTYENAIENIFRAFKELGVHSK